MFQPCSVEVQPFRAVERGAASSLNGGLFLNGVRTSRLVPRLELASRVLCMIPCLIR